MIFFLYGECQRQRISLSMTCRIFHKQQTQICLYIFGIKGNCFNDFNRLDRISLAAKPALATQEIGQTLRQDFTQLIGYEPAVFLHQFHPSRMMKRRRPLARSRSLRPPPAKGKKIYLSYPPQRTRTRYFRVASPFAATGTVNRAEKALVFS